MGKGWIAGPCKWHAPAQSSRQSEAGSGLMIQSSSIVPHPPTVVVVVVVVVFVLVVVIVIVVAVGFAS